MNSKGSGLNSGTAQPAYSREINQQVVAAERTPRIEAYSLTICMGKETEHDIQSEARGTQNRNRTKIPRF